jgi:phosphomevalonate kinase
LFNFGFDEDGKIVPVNKPTKNQWQQLAFARRAIEAICRRLASAGYTVKPFSISINTDQFYLSGDQKVGLGSSAALITAIVYALACFHNAQKVLLPDEPSLFHFCYEVHSEVQHKQGSGIDVAASVFGKVVQYNRFRTLNKTGDGTQVLPYLPATLHWLPVWTGTSSSTSQLLQAMDKFRVENPSEYGLIMEKLSRLSNSGCQALKQNDIETFLARVKEYYSVLQKLSQRSGIPIISPIHEKIAGIVYQAGGYYKPSGAGEGDLGIAFTTSRDVLGEVNKQLKKNNIDTLKLSISQAGVEAI